MTTIPAKHGVVCDRRGELLGYFAWPTIAKQHSGTLVAACSGFRADHVCPWGRTTIFKSFDDGVTWMEPQIINDSPLDDRDAGIISLGGNSLLVSWFTSNTKLLYDNELCREYKTKLPARLQSQLPEKFEGWTDDVIEQHLGSWVMTSVDGNYWSEPVRVPVTAPHGPIRLANGNLFYLGKEARMVNGNYDREVPIHSYISVDRGRNWHLLGTVPIMAGTMYHNYCEPHVVELGPGRLLGVVRFQIDQKIQLAGITQSADFPNLSLHRTESLDGGRTWSELVPMGMQGAPGHLLRHSSGVLICSYGYRRPPFGQRVMLSWDNGQTWEKDLVLRDDGVDTDLGYPASVELSSGDILTVYYQKLSSTSRACSILWSRWSLPEKK